MSIKGKAVQLSQAVEGFLSLGNKNAAPTFYGLIADLEARAGRTDSALASIERARGVAQQNGEHWTDSVLLRRKGEIHAIPIPARPRKPSEPPSLSRTDKTRAASDCKPRLRSPSSTSRMPTPPKLKLSCCRRSKAFGRTPDVPEIAEARALLEGLAMTR